MKLVFLFLPDAVNRCDLGTVYRPLVFLESQLIHGPLHSSDAWNNGVAWTASAPTPIITECMVM